MGVTGLWDLIRPAAARTSLSALSKDAFYANKSGLRAVTVGIDASIWIFHAQVPQFGENPFLRTIFFKITALLQHPLLPVFVFDGPGKPGMKRNQRVAGGFGTMDRHSKQFKEILDVCGLEWWNAPGEAEAELAIMNKQGKIDLILSDDVDALVFGATCVLRNPSATLSGAQASAITQGNTGRSDARAYEMYTSSAIRDLWVQQEGTELKTSEECRLAMVLVALLSGGDYTPEGSFGIGPRLSHGLAHAGLVEYLKVYTTDKCTFEKRLPIVHRMIVEELRTNSAKQLSRKEGAKSKQMEALPAATVFPSTTLEAYLNPCTSPPNNASQGWPGFGKGQPSRIRGKARNEGRGDMEGLAMACERYFEWGTRELVSKKFAGESVGVFAAEVMNSAREAVRARDSESEDAYGTPVSRSVRTARAGSPSRVTSFFQQSIPSSIPSKPSSSLPSSSQPAPASDTPAHILRINSTRPDPTCPDILEYRVSYLHDPYTRRCHAAMNGHRPDPSELSSAEREKLGLVGRVAHDADEDAPPATQSAAPVQKTEVRVWLPEYLVREAWPELVREWEEKVAAKEAAKLKPKKKAAAPKPVVVKVPKTAGVGGAGAGKGKGKKKLEADGENVAAFTSFFAAKNKPPVAASRQESEDRSEGKSESRSEGKSEDNAERTPRQAKAKSKVIDLTLSPTPSPKAGPLRPRSPPVRVKKAVRVIDMSPSSPPAKPSRTRSRSVRTPRQAKAKNVEVIDLSLSPSPSPQAASPPLRRTRSTLTSSVSSTPSDQGTKSGKRQTGKALPTDMGREGRTVHSLACTP
ncbi:hypothetical protein IAT38_000292 [Cryptococcus sp. DSM 104549]